MATQDELAEAIGTDVSGVSRHLSYLKDKKLVTEAGVQIGKKKQVHLHPEAGRLIAVDVSLAHATIAVSELDYGLLNEPRKCMFEVPMSKPKDTLDLLADAVLKQADQLELEAEDVIGIALALPGPISRVKGAPDSPHILPNWEGVEVGRGLSQRLNGSRLEGVQAIVGNDASIGALGVYTRARILDPVQTPEDLIYVRVSNGVGAGIVLKGHLVTGAGGFAGEIGHVRVMPDGPLCIRCNQRGCLETLASRDAILEAIRLKAREDGRPVPLSLDAALAQPDPDVIAEVKRGAWSVGMVMAGVCNLLNPDWIVLGGALAEEEMFTVSVESTLMRYALPAVTTGVRVTTWGGMTQNGKDLPEPRHDPGAAMTPELLGGLAYVVDELGDEHLSAKLI